ncbi:hypothetical protein GCM10010985_30880 [Caballeronia grimmiae]|uniref:Uncharacterized protein n=1 Tax=Caballeronia grimmiae TaxID=1071679 RepID=A0ABQ1RLB4_9BURK|nr:hypothetical protein GCM10010985_30880 [Caballeronia grimmiae]
MRGLIDAITALSGDLDRNVERGAPNKGRSRSGIGCGELKRQLEYRIRDSIGDLNAGFRGFPLGARDIERRTVIPGRKREDAPVPAGDRPWLDLVTDFSRKKRSQLIARERAMLELVSQLCGRNWLCVISRAAS